MTEIVTKFLFKLTSRAPSPKPISLITGPPSSASSQPSDSDADRTDGESDAEDSASNTASPSGSQRTFSQSPTPPVSIRSDADVVSEATSSELPFLPAQSKKPTRSNGKKQLLTTRTRAARTTKPRPDSTADVEALPPFANTASTASKSETKKPTRSSAQSNGKRKATPKEESKEAAAVNAHQEAPANAKTEAETGEKKAEEKRVLRSQDVKPQSELLAYFPWLDDEYAEARKQAEYVGYDEELLVVDDDIKTPPPTPAKSKSRSNVFDKGTSTETNGTSSQVIHEAGLSTKPLFESPPPPQPKQHDPPKPFSYAEARKKAQLLREDPLADSRFTKPHRRAEVIETRARNIERERVQHDRYKFEQYLEQLQGPRWLKLLGYDRIRPTEAERKGLEEKRDALIIEIDLILKKFKDWKEEERRLKAGLPPLQLRSTSDAGSRATSTGAETIVSHEDRAEDEAGPSNTTSATSKNASRKRKASSAVKAPSKPAPKKSIKTITNIIFPSEEKQPTPPPPELKPLTSFYDNDIAREASLKAAKSGRVTRSTTAFGKLLPPFEEKEFNLNQEILDEVERKRKQSNNGDKENELGEVQVKQDGENMEETGQQHRSKRLRQK